MALGLRIPERVNVILRSVTPLDCFGIWTKTLWVEWTAVGGEDTSHECEAIRVLLINK